MFQLRGLNSPNPTAPGTVVSRVPSLSQGRLSAPLQSCLNGPVVLDLLPRPHPPPAVIGAGPRRSRFHPYTVFRSFCLNVSCVFRACDNPIETLAPHLRDIRQEFPYLKREALGLLPKETALGVTKAF